jgi:hypothetical protein
MFEISEYVNSFHHINGDRLKRGVGCFLPGVWGVPPALIPQSWGISGLIEAISLVILYTSIAGFNPSPKGARA